MSTGAPGGMGGPTTGGIGTDGAFGGLGTGDLTAGSGTVAAGSSGQDYGFGINPATGEPWSPSDPDFTEKFGTFDPTIGNYISPIRGKTYEPATGTWTTPAGPGTGDTGGTGGISTGYGHFDPRTQARRHQLRLQSRQRSLFRPCHGKWRDVDTGDLNNTAKQWDDLSQRMERAKGLIDALKDAVKFAKLVEPRSGYCTAQTTASTYSQASSNKMGRASQKYKGLGK